MGIDWFVSFMRAFGLVVASGSEDLEHLRFAVGFWGVGCAAAGPAVNALAQELAPKGGEGESLTLPKTAADIVFLIGPVILGERKRLLRFRKCRNFNHCRHRRRREYRLRVRRGDAQKNTRRQRRVSARRDTQRTPGMY